MLNEVKHLAILGKIRLKLRETLRFAQGDRIFNTLVKQARVEWENGGARYQVRPCYLF